MKLYADTSALAKLVVEEPESARLASYLDALDAAATVASSTLAETELRRLCGRLGIAQHAATAVLDRIDLVNPDRAVFHEAGLLPGSALRSLDALHLATAIRIGADVVLAYDHRLLDAARAIGLSIVSPGVQEPAPSSER